MKVIKQQIPLGIEFFSTIKENNYYYVDKTDIIKFMLTGAGVAVHLFTRPRRFGKTLTMTMLRDFFNIGTDMTLFDGLKISKEKKLCEQYQGKYPVLFITFKDFDVDNFDGAKQKMSSAISEAVKQYRYLVDDEKINEEDRQLLLSIITEQKDVDWTKSLRNVTDIFNRYFNQKVILLIDEYDVPLDKARKFGYYNEMIILMRSLYNNVLKTNVNIEFAVLTGCLRISKESIFTGLNNLVAHSILDDTYDEYFGFTDKEVMDMLKYYDLDFAYDVIKEWYDGYHVGNSNIYCPWDVMNYCYDLLCNRDAEPKAYWINTSSNDLVKSLISTANNTVKDEIEDLMLDKTLVKKIKTDLTYEDLDVNSNDIWSILFATGYLTQVGKLRDDYYKVKIPNNCVKKVYESKIEEWFADQYEKPNYVEKLLYGFDNKNTEIIEQELNKMLSKTISILDAKAPNNKKELFYHGILLGLLQMNQEWVVKSNIESGDGFPDIVIKEDDSNISILELKYSDSYKNMDKACNNAISQIVDKKYAEGFLDGRPLNITIYGISFYKKSCKVICKKL